MLSIILYHLVLSIAMLCTGCVIFACLGALEKCCRRVFHWFKAKGMVMFEDDDLRCCSFLAVAAVTIGTAVSWALWAGVIPMQGKTFLGISPQGEIDILSLGVEVHARLLLRDLMLAELPVAQWLHLMTYHGVVSLVTGCAACTLLLPAMVFVEGFKVVWPLRLVLLLVYAWTCTWATPFLPMRGEPWQGISPSNLDAVQAIADARLKSVTYDVELEAFWPDCGALSPPALKRVYGSFQPGTLTWILGPDPLATTSLLQLLGGRVTGRSCVSGELALNSHIALSTQHGERLSLDSALPSLPRRHLQETTSYYVEQQPPSQLSLPESLRYAAMWQRPDLSPQERAQHINKTLGFVDMGLQGDVQPRSAAWLNSIEAKRAGLAAALVADRPILLLDDPIAGLPSDDAAAVARTLRAWARESPNRPRSVIATARGLDDESFHKADNIILLSAEGGQMMYWGRAASVVEYFEGLGLNRSRREVLVHQYLMRMANQVAVDGATPSDDQPLVALGTSSVARQTAKPVAVDDLDVFFIHFEVAWRRGLAVVWSNLIRDVLAVCCAAIFCLSLRSIQTADAMKFASGLYVMNAIMLVLVGVAASDAVTIAMTTFMQQEKPAGFNSFSFLLGEWLSLMVQALVFTACHVSFISFANLKHQAGIGCYFSCYALAYVYSASLALMAGWVFLDPHVSKAVVCGIQFTSSTCFAGFIPQYVDMVGGGWFASIIIQLSPPCFLFRAILCKELMHSGVDDAKLFKSKEERKNFGNALGLT